MKKKSIRRGVPRSERRQPSVCRSIWGFQSARERLESIKKLDELIDSKMAERDRIHALRINTVGSIDGVPRSSGITDKIGTLTVKLITLEEELDSLIDRYVDEKADIVTEIEGLPEREYGVIHRYYIRRMTLEQVAEDIGYCTSQVWRIKEKGIEILDENKRCN